jgi:hypothetical protein
MLKNLLYLYNDGHNPFPQMQGYGGLGYHLPEYHKVIHGSGGENDEETIDEETYDKTMKENEQLLMKANEILNKQEARRRLNEEGGGGGETLEELGDEMNKLLHKHEFHSVYNKIKKVGKKETADEKTQTNPIETKKNISAMAQAVNKVNKEAIEKAVKESTNETEMKEPIKEKKKTKKEIENEQKNVKLAIKDKLYNRGIKKPAETKIVIDDIISKLPELTVDEFNKDPEKYLNMHYNKKYENIEKMETIKKAVSEEHGQGETDTKGHAAEIVLLRDYQNDIKELTGSTDTDDTISLSSESDGFKNNDGVVPLSWTGKPVSYYSLFDADGKNASIDLKYYDSENVDIQFSKIDGNVDNIPLYCEIDGKIKLYNVVNKTTKKLINKFNNTDTYIVAKTPSTLASWQLNKFIQENINKQTEVKNIKYNGIDCFMIEPSFMERMIKEEKVKRGKTHKEDGWFTVNTKKMIKK